MNKELQTVDKIDNLINTISVDLNTSILKMSSKEISEICEKEHKHVIRDIKKILEDLSLIDGPNLDHVESPLFSLDFDTRGYISNIWLDKELTLTLVAGYNVKFRYQVVKRWLELESKTVPQSYSSALELAAQQAKELEAKSELLGYTRELLQEVKPKVEYHDIILSCPDLVTVSTIAHDYGMSAQKMNKLLNELGVQYKNKQGVWVLFTRYISSGYAKLETVSYKAGDDLYKSRHHLKWTQKGRLFIYDLLKSKDIYPVCEQDN